MKNCTFTSAERQAYWSRMNNLKSLLLSQRRTGQDNVALYDYLLISKGMLLGTSLGDVYRNAGMAVPDSPYTPLSISSEDEAMLRSGLMLAGGNRAWQGAEVPKGMEDGVLTASEISLMDLRKTDMAVLSACETGLGDISDEGVLGLQRAFKNAGVKTVIMSLWRVDDEATSFMMTEFYKNLLAGKSKREAFRLAQDTVRGRYEDPFYWAAFIMLD